LEDFNETWYKEKYLLCRCAYHKGKPVQLFFKELQPLDLLFFPKNALSSQVLLYPSGDFDENWFKERSHCVFCKGNPVQLTFKDLWPLGFAFSLKNILVFTTPLEPFEGF
jgi:hypothetical protein